jgi:hypothetical protein
MGTWMAVAGVRNSGPVGLAALADVADRTKLRSQARYGSWRFAGGRWTPIWRCEELAAELAGQANSAAIAAWVRDSDDAYIGASEPGGESCSWLAIGEAVSAFDDEAADPEIEEIRRHNERWLSPATREQAAQELAAWSERWAPAAISAAAIIDAWRDDEDYPGDGPVFKEDALREIFTGMGFPPFDLIAQSLPAE